MNDKKEPSWWWALVLPFAFIWSSLEAIYDLLKHWRDNPARKEREALELNYEAYAQAVANYSRDKDQFIEELLEELGDLPFELRALCVEVASRIWNVEDFDIPKPPPVANSIEGARYRDQLSKLSDIRTVQNNLIDVFRLFVSFLPPEGDGISFSMPLKDSIPGEFIEQLIVPLYRDESHFPNTCELLDKRLHLMSGVPFEPASANKLVLPSAYKGKEPISAYLYGTPLYKLLDITVPLSISPDILMEHVHIIGSTGSGKTQLLQYLIAQLSQTDSSIVVMDSQGEMIDKLLHYEDIPEDRFVVIDPTDIEFPIGLNIFDVPVSNNPVDAERQMNTAIELIEYVFSSIMDAESTSKQRGLVRNVIRLLIYIPEATINTFIEILSDGVDPYKDYIQNLNSIGKRFFEQDFDSRSYAKTKEEVLWRVNTLLENPAIFRMFSSPRNLFSIGELMDQRKVILVNTAKDFLQEGASAFFGRFFVSLLLQSAQSRASRKERIDTYFLVDEAQEYVDRNISTLLVQARKYRVSVILAHQYLNQLPSDALQSVMGNTLTKFAGRVSASDARALAPDLHTTKEFLSSIKKLTFALYVSDDMQNAITINVPAGYIEDRSINRDINSILQRTRHEYSYQREDSGIRSNSGIEVPRESKDDDIDFFNEN